MDSNYEMTQQYHTGDPGALSFVANIFRKALHNPYFRSVIWTGDRLQLTVMCIPVHREIGLEVHPDTDQLIRIEEGEAVVRMGEKQEQMNFRRSLCPGDGILIPRGTWHNVVNTGTKPLKLSSVYAPPHHPRGAIHRTKEDAQSKEKRASDPSCINGC